MPLLNTRLKSWWLTIPVVDRTVRCQGSVLGRMCGSSLTGTSFCSSQLLPWHSGNSGHGSHLNMQPWPFSHRTQFHLSGHVTFHKTLVSEKWSSFCLYISKLSIFSAALNLCKTVPLFRTQPKPHLAREAFWDVSNARGYGLPCTPNTVQLALDNCFSWVLMKLSTSLRAETISSPSLGVLPTPLPRTIRISSHSWLNVYEQTKSVESEGWKLDEFEWQL